MDYWFCVSVYLCVSVFSRERHNVQMLRASLSEKPGWSVPPLWSSEVQRLYCVRKLIPFCACFITLVSDVFFSYLLSAGLGRRSKDKNKQQRIVISIKVTGYIARSRNFFSYACSGQRQFSTVSFSGFGLWVRVRVTTLSDISLSQIFSNQCT